MVLPDTGSISFQQIQTELGGSNPISLNEYYSDNSSKYSYTLTAIPKTGNPISISHFRGVSKVSVPAETTYNAGRSVYVNEQNGITKEINIYTDPYWTQTIKIYVQPQEYKIVSYTQRNRDYYIEGFYNTDIGEYEEGRWAYGYEWGYDYEWVNIGGRILLSTSIVYANNYSPFAVTQNTNDNNFYVTLLHNLAFDGQGNTNRHIYWRRTGEFFVNIVYSIPP